MTFPKAYMLAIMKAWHAGADSYDIAKALKISEDSVIDALAEIRAKNNSAATREGHNLRQTAMRA